MVRGAIVPPGGAERKLPGIQGAAADVVTHQVGIFPLHIVRAAPPAVGSASNTSTRRPASTSAIAAARPFGPAPVTHARRLIASNPVSENCPPYPIS